MLTTLLLRGGVLCDMDICYKYMGLAYASLPNNDKQLHHIK